MSKREEIERIKIQIKDLRSDLSAVNNDSMVRDNRIAASIERLDKLLAEMGNVDNRLDRFIEEAERNFEEARNDRIEIREHSARAYGKAVTALGDTLALDKRLHKLEWRVSTNEVDICRVGDNSTETRTKVDGIIKETDVAGGASAALHDRVGKLENSLAVARERVGALEAALSEAMHERRIAHEWAVAALVRSAVLEQDLLKWRAFREDTGNALASLRRCLYDALALDEDEVDANVDLDDGDTPLVEMVKDAVTELDCWREDGNRLGALRSRVIQALHLGDGEPTDDNALAVTIEDVMQDRDELRREVGELADELVAWEKWAQAELGADPYDSANAREQVASMVRGMRAQVEAAEEQCDELRDELEAFHQNCADALGHAMLTREGVLAEINRLVSLPDAEEDASRHKTLLRALSTALGLSTAYNEEDIISRVRRMGRKLKEIEPLAINHAQIKRMSEAAGVSSTSAVYVVDNFIGWATRLEGKCARLAEENEALRGLIIAERAVHRLGLEV